MWLICIKYAPFNDNDNINNNHYHSTFKRISILIKVANVFLCDLDHIKQLIFGAGRGRDGENHLHRCENIRRRALSRAKNRRRDGGVLI